MGQPEVQQQKPGYNAKFCELSNSLPHKYGAL